MKKEIHKIKRFYLLFIAVLTAVTIISLLWNIKKEKKFAYQYAKVEALASYNKDLLFRRWVSMHGGVYVQKTNETPSNPHLSHVPKRDVVIDSVDYTLMNPAYVIRQVHDISHQQFGVKGHITSLNPIRKENKADEWEAQALMGFNRGLKDTSAIVSKDGKVFMRFMKPMVTEQSCLYCHAKQGYQLGDIRGGISVEVPMEQYLNTARAKIQYAAVLHLTFYIFILLLSFIMGNNYLKEVNRKNRVQQQLLEHKAELQEQNSEYYALNEELIEAKERAEESDRLKTSFLHNMSHEIRTPMNSIIGFTDLLENPNLANEKKHSFISIIQNSSKQLLNIVTDVLTIASIEVKQIKISNIEFTANKVLRELAEVFQIQCEPRNLKFELEIPLPDNQSIVFSDKTKFTLVLTNLLSNAIKFTPKGTINLGYEVQEKHLKFFVEDTGIGIEPEAKEKIFQRFIQADDQINRKYGGTGLGLSISNELIELLGSKLNFSTEVGKGSCFYFKLPVKKASDASINKYEDVLSEKNITLLIAEDQENNFRLFQEIFSPNTNITLINAKNGKEAIDICRSNKNIDLVLMDIRMPIMNGIDAMKVIHHEYPKIPVIAQTAYAMVEEVDEFKEKGFADLISKPIDKEVLRQKIFEYV